MTTQSLDTHPTAERIMVNMIRKASISKRFRLVQSLTQSALWSSLHAWQDAIRHSTLYNVIHLNTMLKIDLIPLKRRAFTKEEAHRAQPHLLEAGARPVRIASAEDAILTKLE